MGKKHEQSVWPFAYIKREKRGPSLHPPTEAQMQQRMKFSVAAKFLVHLKAIIPVVTCKGMKHNRKFIFAKKVPACGFTGVYPNYEIDYGKLKLTSGRLSNTFHGARWHSKGIMLIGWDCNWRDYTNECDQNVYVFVYNSTTRRSYMYNKKATRGDGAVFIEISGRDKYDDVHVWVFFKSEDKKQISNSLYCKVMGDGSVIMPDEF